MIIKNELKDIDKVKLLMLDVDGTLVRFTNLNELMKKTLKEMHIPYSDKKFERYVKAVSEILKDSENDFIFNFVALCRYIDKNKVLKDKKDTPIFLSKMINDEVNYVEECEGAKEFLELASENFELVCSTNWFKSSQQQKLKRFDMFKYIKNIYTCENNISKPSTHHYLHVLNQEVIKPTEAIMIGDSITDIPDKKLKLQSILYDPKGQKEKLYDNASCVITELKDLETVLKIKNKLKSI